MGNIKDLPVNFVANCPEGGPLDVAISEVSSTEKLAFSSDGWVGLPDETYQELYKYELSAGETLYLKEILIALVGMAAKFRVEIFDGTTSTYPYEYVLNTQQPVFSQVLPKEETIPYQSGAYVRVEAKMLAQNQQGQAFTSLNIFK